MRWHPASLLAGLVLGMTASLGAAAFAGRTSAVPTPLRPVSVTLHRFDIAPGQEGHYADWIAFLHAQHRAAVGTLGRERTYLEAMFRADDEPRRLYWLTIQGVGSEPVESSTLEVDRRHMAYMAEVLVPRSHARLATENVLAPDAMILAVREQQAREGGS